MLRARLGRGPVCVSSWLPGILGSAAGRAWCAVLDTAAPAQGIECFVNREQLGGRNTGERPRRGHLDKQARGHDIVGCLKEYESVGVPECVPIAVQLAAGGFEDRAKRRPP